MEKIKKFFINAIMLTSASLLMRTISVSFNVYLSNKIGAAGMGLIGLIMSVYTFAVTFATSGISLASTRLCSEAISMDNHNQVKHILRKCISYALFFSSIAAIVLLFGADFIANTLLRDDRTTLSLRFLGISLVPIALSSVFNGYFLALRRVYKNALTQVFEQGVKIVLTIYALLILLPKGIEYSALAVVASGSIAEFISFLFLYVQFLFDKRLHLKNQGVKDSSKSTVKAMLGISLPVAFSAYVRSGLITIEHLLIPIGLEKSGKSRDYSLAAYGTLQSMVFPIVFFPIAIVSSFSSLLVPELTECQTHNNNIRRNYIISRVFQFTLLFSIGVSGVLAAYSHELGSVIYNSSDAAKFIKMIAPLIPIMYIDNASDAMLKGLGLQVYSMKINILDAFVSVILVYFLVPLMGIEGYIVTIYICELINCVATINKLLQVTNLKTKVFNWLFKPLVSIIGATSITRILLYCLKLPLATNGLILTSYIVFTSILYMFLMWMMFGLTNGDIKWIVSIFKFRRKDLSSTLTPHGKVHSHTSL